MQAIPLTASLTGVRPRLLMSGIAALATASMVVAACGSSGGAGGAGSSAGAGSGTAAQAGAPLKLAVLCSCQGAFGAASLAAEQVAESWAKSVNASGGLNGHHIQLTKYVDAGNPGTAVTQAQKAISSHADVIMDLTNLDQTWAKAAADAKIPVVGGESTSVAFVQYPNFYSSTQTINALPESIAVTAKLAGATNLGMLYCSEAPSCQETLPGMKAAGKKAGVPVVYSAAISATAPDYTAQCVAAKQAHVSALYVSHLATVLVKVARDCDRQGYDPTIIAAGTGFSTIYLTAPGARDNLWASFPILPYFADTAAVKRMNTAVDKYYPKLRSDQNAWSTFAAQAWTGAMLIEAAFKAAGVGPRDPLSAAVVTKGLTSLKDETLDGWSPPLTFQAGKPNPVNCWYTARIKGGKPMLANNGKLSCLTGS